MSAAIIQIVILSPYMSGQARINYGWGLISFVIEVEQQIEEKFNISLTIAIDDILDQDDGPFQSIGSLSRYCLELINKAKH